MAFLRFKDGLLDIDQITIVWLNDHGVRLEKSRSKYVDVSRTEDCDEVWEFFLETPPFIQVRHNALVNFNHVVEICFPNDDDVRLTFLNTTSIECCERFRENVKALVENLDSIPMFSTDQQLVSLRGVDQSNIVATGKPESKPDFHPYLPNQPRKLLKKPVYGSRTISRKF